MQIPPPQQIILYLCSSSPVDGPFSILVPHQGPLQVPAAEKLPQVLHPPVVIRTLLEAVA